MSAKGFSMLYLWNGSKRKFFPDFLIRMKNGTMLVLEVKGIDSSQNKEKRRSLNGYKA